MARPTSSSVTLILFFPHLRDHEAEADPAVGNLLVFLLGGLFGGVLVSVLPLDSIWP